MKIVVLLLVTIGLAAEALAQKPPIPFDGYEEMLKDVEATPTPQAVSTPSAMDSALQLSAVKGDPFIALRLQVELSERNFRYNASPKTRDAFVFALENLANAHCMSDLFSTLRYFGPPTEKVCSDLLAQIATLDQDNPVVICANEGIDSPNCRAAYKLQKTGQLVAQNTTATLSPAEELTKKLEATKLQNALNKLSPELNNATAAYKRKKDEDTSAKVKDITKQILEVACKDTQLKLELRPEVKNKPDDTSLQNQIEALSDVGKSEPKAKNEPTPKSIEKLSDIFERKEKEKQPTPIPNSGLLKPGPFLRTRLISNLCKSYIDYGSSFDAQFSAPICYRDGFYTPTCIDALRVARTKNQQQGVVPSKPSHNQKDGLSSF